MTISVDVQLRQLPTARCRHRLRKPSARRALTELGPNDTKRNLVFVEKLLALSQEKFRERWNFDPVAERPIATGGHFLWTPVSQAGRDPRPHDETSPSVSATVSDRLSAPAAPEATPNPTPHAAPTTPPSTPPATAPADEHSRIPSSSENHSKLRSVTTASPTEHHYSAGTSSNASSTNTAPASINQKRMTETRLIQRKITDFGKQRKRMHSQCKFEDGDPEALGPSPSKRRASEALRVR